MIIADLLREDSMSQKRPVDPEVKARVLKMIREAKEKIVEEAGGLENFRKILAEHPKLFALPKKDPRNSGP